MTQNTLSGSNSVEEIKKEIDLINNFSMDFYAKNNTIISKMNSVMLRLDQIITDEKKNDTHLQTLKDKVSDSELNRTMVTMFEYKESIDKKSTEYTSLIENNKRLIHEISETIKNNESVIRTISEIVKSLEDSTTSLERKLL